MLAVLDLVPAGAQADLEPPAAISATVAAILARLPGRRNVTGETSVPTLMRVVSRASPASVAQASVVGLPESPGKLA